MKICKASVSCLGSLLTSVLWFSPAQAEIIGTDITDITTRTISTSFTTSTNDVKGDSEFAGRTFTLNFGGQIQSITKFSFLGGSSRDARFPAKVFIRRNPATDKRQLAYYQGTFDQNTSTFNFLSLGPLPEIALFGVNNILAGPDNIFTNAGANLGGTPYNGNASIERVDFILTSSVNASIKTGFSIFERGLPTGHDGFGIAAITSVDRFGNPKSYGQIYIVAANTWGKTPLLESIPQYYFLNNAANGNQGTPKNPALTIPPNQTLGGILIRTSELAPLGQRIYGYSLFAPDVTCTPETLVNITASCFPTNTGTTGGLDLAAPNLGTVILKSEN